MATVAEIQRAITSLPKTEYEQLRSWFDEYDWDEWDREFEADAKAGKLDFLAERVAEAKRRGTLKDL